MCENAQLLFSLFAIAVVHDTSGCLFGHLYLLIKVVTHTSGQRPKKLECIVADQGSELNQGFAGLNQGSAAQMLNWRNHY